MHENRMALSGTSFFSLSLRSTEDSILHNSITFRIARASKHPTKEEGNKRQRKTVGEKNRSGVCVCVCCERCASYSYSISVCCCGVRCSIVHFVFGIVVVLRQRSLSLCLSPVTVLRSYNKRDEIHLFIRMFSVWVCFTWTQAIDRRMVQMLKNECERDG